MCPSSHTAPRKTEASCASRADSGAMVSHQPALSPVTMPSATPIDAKPARVNTTTAALKSSGRPSQCPRRRRRCPPSASESPIAWARVPTRMATEAEVRAAVSALPASAARAGPKR